MAFYRVFTVNWRTNGQSTFSSSEQGYPKTIDQGETLKQSINHDPMIQAHDLNSINFNSIGNISKQLIQAFSYALLSYDALTNFQCAS